MNKRKLLAWVLPFAVSFLIVLGVLVYRGRKREERRPPVTAEELLGYDVQGKSPREIAMWIYDNYNCKTCHALTNTGILGLTSRGQELAKDFEGCPGMMQTVTETLSIPEARWTEKHKRVRTNFVQFGCAFCHQVDDNGIGLTEVGSRASTLHMTCPEVMSAVNR